MIVTLPASWPVFEEDRGCLIPGHPRDLLRQAAVRLMSGTVGGFSLHTSWCEGKLV